MVALFSNANVFKGIAWVRRFTSTTVLELENQFVDPVTGLYAAQVVGDQVLVSKNSAESAAAGWAVTTPDTNVVTVTDNVLMGTAGSEVSLCFYDEHKQFTMTNGFRFNGGVAVFGKLMSYDGVSKESFTWSRECTARPNENYPLSGSPAYNLWGTGDTASHMFFFGGAIGSPMRRSFFIGAEGTGATNKTFAFYGTRIYHACASPNNGGNWSANAARHLLYKTIHEADYNNANLVVWGNGAFEGEFLSFPQFGAGTPLGIFRASGAVTFGASANNRTIVNDTGSGSFIDDINNGTYTFTNVITPAVSISRHPGGSTPIEFRFSDDYTNLKMDSTVVVRRTVDSVVAASVVNTASAKFTATVVQANYSATANGAATPTNFYTSFDYTAKCYGFQAISGNHSTYTYSLGTAGNGTDLKLGGLINQVVDSTTTLTLAQALALSTKIAGNSGTDTATVSGSSTLDEQYDYLVAWGCSSAALAQFPSLSLYPVGASGTTSVQRMKLVVSSGATLSAGAKLKDMSGTKQVEITGAGSTATFDRGTITWAPSTYLSQWFVQSGGTLTLTNNSLYTVNAQASLGYDTKTMFGTDSTLNLNNSTMVFNAPTSAISYGGSVFSAFQSNGTATMNITNGTWTFNGPTANSTYVIHTYWTPSSAINGLIINGTAATAVALEMGKLDQKLVGLTFGGQFNGAFNAVAKAKYVTLDSLTYTGSVASLVTSTARTVRWVWLDPVRSDGALFRWNNAPGAHGVVWFRPTITIDKAGYAPKMRLSPSALASRYPSKIVQTTEQSTVALNSFYTDVSFDANDGALPFVDSLDVITTTNTINWTLDFRQNGWAGQTATFTAAAAKKGLITYSAGGSADSNYINDTTGAADALLITVNETTKVLAAATGTLAWSAQRTYNALVNKWSSFAMEQNIVAASAGGSLDLANYTVDDSIRFIRGSTTDLLSQVRTTGIIESQANEVPVADVNGSRASVSGLDPQAFGVTWFLRWKKTSASTWTTSSGTGNTTQIVVDTAVYSVQARVPGYDWKTVEFDSALSLSLDMNLQYQVSANNTPQYTMTYEAVLEAIFQYDATAMKVSVANTTSGILQPGFAELYQATQRIQHIPALVWTWTGPVSANATSQKILIPTGNPISMYLTDASTNTVKITCPVIHADTGQSADDRVRGNPSGYSIILGSPATAESAGLAAQIISGLGGSGYTEAEASQVALKALIDEVQALVGQVKARTDLVPDEPAAVGDAMTLTAAYDAAKTAATQTSVNGVASAVTALGEPLQAADYTEPATAEAIATQVEVQIINDDDGRAVLQAIADKIMAEEISSTVIAQSVRAELATELGRIDVAISTRSTLTAEDIPEGLTAAEVWSATTRTLTEAAGLTTEQAAQLAALPTLTEIEGTTVLAKAADLEGLPTLADIEGSTVLAKSADVDALAGDVPTASETAAAVLGATVETGATVAQSLRLANAVLGGKVSGGQTGTETFRDLADTKDVVVSTNDAAGNRTAVVTNLS
jgi:hypothetical protein